MGLPRNIPGGKSNTFSDPGVDPSTGLGELRPLEEEVADAAGVS